MSNECIVAAVSLVKYTSLCFQIKKNKIKIKMKYTAVFVIFCLIGAAVCAERITTWGNVYGKEVGSENVVVPSTIFKVKTYDFTFPKVCHFSLRWSFIILNLKAFFQLNKINYLAKPFNFLGSIDRTNHRY